MKIGFIGLGVMGKPMAQNLIRAGHELYINDWAPTAYSEMEAMGAMVCATAAETAKNAKVVITMLPNFPNVMDAVCGETGMLKEMGEGHVLIDMSSISPDGTRKIHALLKEKGVEMMDAPVSGGQAKAVDGTLSIMVGADSAVFQEYLPVLQCMGSAIVHIGDVGAGNVAKLANQMIVASTMAGISEAMQLTRRYGVDEAKVYDAIKGGMAGSSVLSSKLPSMLEGNFKPGFRAALMAKDLGNALDAAKAAGFAPAITENTLRMLQELAQAGHDGDDHSILYTYYDN